MKSIIDEWVKDADGFYVGESLLKTLKERISEAINEIPLIHDDVGKGCNNNEERTMFRKGYKNGRTVFKSQLKQTLLTGSGK